MDNLTHSLFALTLARTSLRPAGERGRGATAVLVLSSNAPDIDVVAAFSNGPGSYLAAHRGPTHGLAGVVVLAIACAAIVAMSDRIRARRTEASRFLSLLPVAALGVMFHVLMDLPTPYGMRILSPFSERWYAFDWMPIIDVYLLLLLAGALVSGRTLQEHRRKSAHIALTLMAANYAVHAAAHAAAVVQGGGTAPWRLESWSGERPLPCPDTPCASIAAIPTFLSPFTWRIVRPTGSGYELFNLSTMTKRRSMRRLVPDDENRWTERARESSLGRIFNEFARFPAATSTGAADGGAIVRMQDVRYTGSTGGGGDARSPFLAVIELDADGRVRRERIGR